ncbi:MAG: transporter substrate-binding domain-containing protein [Gammaproteobacteria bacterium]|nr:transporter substrate-binding domain-containing protein [Gammaproteobacteria bacterium]MYE52071.1 transporter substrate-binding domain-containing protein [Gammaproteobacteria bacterium]
MGFRLRFAPAPLAVAAAALLFLVGCGEPAREEPPPSARSLPDLSHLALVTAPHTDDFDGMAERRTIRALVVRSKTFYFFDGAAKRGLSYERLRAFEAYVNDQRETSSLRINLIFLPVTRNQLIPALLAGYGDLAVANLTITPERQAQVDFSIPVQREVREILVTGPASEPIAAIESLSGKTLHTRISSSYHESLTALNERFAASGLPPVDIVPVDEHLEDEELLEMVNASLIPRIVIDSHKAEFWAQIFDSIEVRSDVVLRDQADIAWAFRPGSPELKAMVDGFLMNVREGSLTGNLLLQRYLKETRYVENALHSSEMRKFDETAHLFQEYGDRYDFDWLMVMSQAYQESRLDQSLRSHAGAIGVMQLLPSTAADKNVNVGDITELENNIHAGNKYLRFIRDRYFESEPMDDLNKTLFAFASYNAGPARVSRLRTEAEQQGLDPNVWFDNVEAVAAQRIGRETVDYVSNIYKYWIAYRLSRDQLAQAAAQGRTAHDG